jgi:hypothetical protein
MTKMQELERRLSLLEVRAQFGVNITQATSVGVFQIEEQIMSKEQELLERRLFEIERRLGVAEMDNARLEARLAALEYENAELARFVHRAPVRCQENTQIN